MQTNVVVGQNAITGTLKYVTGYTGFSEDPELQSGNYIALKLDTDVDATITVELVGGESGPVTLDTDKNIVIRVTDPLTQTIKATATSGTKVDVLTYSLASMTLESE